MCNIRTPLLALCCRPAVVCATDIHLPALRNAVYNFGVNGFQLSRTGVRDLPVPPPPPEPGDNPNPVPPSEVPSLTDVADEAFQRDANQSIQLVSSAKGVSASVSHLLWQDVDADVKIGSVEIAGKVDVLLGSDLVYDKGAASLLADVVQRLLRIGRGRLIDT